MQSQLKILFIDDHVGLRDAIINVLVQRNSQMLIIPAANKTEALEELQKDSEIQLVILDLNLNGDNGLLLINELRKIASEIKILVYSMFNDPIHIEQSLNYSIMGYISKDAKVEDLEKAIKTVLDGDYYFNKQAKEIVKILLNKNGSKTESMDFTGEGNSETKRVYELYLTLTQKEKDVFYYLAQKEDADEIAKILGKSEKTVVNQKSIIYSKMNIRDRLELLEKAKILGLII